MTMSRRDAITLSGSTLAGLSLARTAPAWAREPGAGHDRWWIDEPIRMALVLFDQTRPPLDTDRYIDWMLALGANALYLPTGGIAAYYPTRVPFHFKATGLPPGRDLVGEIVTKAHANNIRVISRFEWSFHQDPRAVAAHPEWMQRTGTGEIKPVNGAFLTCVNAGYVRKQALKILGEVVARYPIDGVFFNGVFQRMNNGPCHCATCRTLFEEHYGRPLPAQADEDYTAFRHASMESAADTLVDFLRSKRPDPGFNMMWGPGADSINYEVHSAPVASSNGYWVYHASETVNRLRNANPEMMAFNNDAAFIDGYWRYAHRSEHDGEIRAYQNMANGAGPFLFVNGPIDQFDPRGVRGAQPAFHFHKQHADLYVRQENAARVLLLEQPGTGDYMRYTPRHDEPVNAGNGGFGYRDTDGVGLPGDVSDGSGRGMFRLLSEAHIPFVLSSDLGWIAREPDRYDLVVCPKGVPAALGAYLKGGGRVLAASAVRPELDLPPTARLWRRQETLSSYWRIRDHELFPSLRATQIILNYSDFLELEAEGPAKLTLVPPTITLPMEKVGEGMHDTDKSGLHVMDYGAGRLAYLPWDIGDLYYRVGSPSHAELFGDLIDHILPRGRQLRTNAHPMVQITLQRQRHKRRTLVHFVNLSGFSQVSYHPAIPMSDIHIQLTGCYTCARQVSLERDLDLTTNNERAACTLPRLGTNDVVV